MQSMPFVSSFHGVRQTNVYGLGRRLPALLLGCDVHSHIQTSVKSRRHWAVLMCRVPLSATVGMDYYECTVTPM